MQRVKDSAENARPHLLIVDDDVEMCEVLRRYLEAQDFAVRLSTREWQE
jgi:ActR/RegA family two-component response regulator